MATAVAVGRDSAAIVYVDGRASGANDGTIWVNAYTHLQDALLTTGPVEIWVAKGTYTPAGPNGNRAATFLLRAGQALYGGFSGSETARAQRNPSANPTILSGDLNGDDLPGLGNFAENSYHVATCRNAGANTVLDGFTILHGSANLAFGPDSYGGGLYNENASPIVTACRFIEHVSHSGGAVLVFGGFPQFTLCVFQGCRVQNGKGGGIIITAGGGATISDCVFQDNAVSGSVGSNDGGALYLDLNTTVTITRCSFVNNSCLSLSQTMAATGGAITSLSPGLKVISCIFRANTANTGGAVWNGSTATFQDCLFDKNTALVGAATQADLGGVGGALTNLYSNALLAGCVGVANTGNDGGGIFNGTAGITLTLTNSILWGNSDASGFTRQAQYKGAGSYVVRYSCVQNLFTPVPGEPPPDPINYPGCIAIDPQFADANGIDNIAGTADDDLRLQSGSPCIDAGNNADVPAWLTHDLDNLGRFADDPATTDTGSGTPPIADMGVYEFTPAAAPIIANNPVLLNVNVYENGVTVYSPLSVANARPYGTTMAYTLAAAPAWLTCSPAAGLSTGGVVMHTVSCNPAGLAPGDYAGTITITAAGAANNPVRVPVSLRVASTHATVGPHSLPAANLTLPDWNDTEIEKMSVLKFRISDPVGDSLPTRIDRIEIAVTGTAGHAGNDIAWAELRSSVARVALAASITDSSIVFGSTPNSDGVGQLATVPSGSFVEYSVHIYLSTSLLGTHDSTYIFDTDETRVGCDGTSSTQMATDSGGVIPVVGTLFIAQLGVSVSPNAWAIGPIGLSATTQSAVFTLTNSGNTAEDLLIRGADGAGGWLLAAAAGPNAFRVDKAADGVYDFILTKLEQVLAVNLAASGGASTLRLRYASPTSDAFGGGTPQDFVITVRAIRHVP